MTTLARFFDRLTRPRALGLVLALWAAIYLPGLGSLEIKGEEGRRILPAVAMLDTGDWLVPQVGGVPYFSKPPLINWLVAGAFKLTGTRGEWAARLPSVLAVLALGLAAVWTLSRSLGVGGALLTAVFLLTNIGLMEKGRLAEIESVYLGLYGLALLAWLGGWRRDAEPSPEPCPTFPWRTWTLPFLFLGLGLLTKGPLHLVYFYAVVGAVLGFTGRWRDALNWAHALGLGLMLGLFAAWAVPYFREMRAGEAAGKWYAQMAGRVEVGEKFSLSAWLLNGPRGLVNFLPWTCLLPLAWRSGARVPPDAPSAAPLDLAVARGLRWAVGVPFVAVSLAPGGIPRYTLPLLVPAAVGLGLAFARLRPPGSPAGLARVWAAVVALCLALVIVGAPVAAGFGGGGGGRVLAAVLLPVAAACLLWRRDALRRFAEEGGAGSASSGGVPGVLPLALASGAVMALLTACYVLAQGHRFHRQESVRPVGLSVRRAVPAGEPVAALRPGFLPFLFYVNHLSYLQTPDHLPPGLRYLLVRQKDLPEATSSLAAQGVASRTVLNAWDKRLRDSRESDWVLLALDRPENSPPKGSL